MDSSVSPKDEIWFLRVCHHISNAVYNPLTCNSPSTQTVHSRRSLTIARLFFFIPVLFKSSPTSSLHLLRGLPLFHFPTIAADAICLGIPWSFVLTTWPYHFNPRDFCELYSMWPPPITPFVSLIHYLLHPILAGWQKRTSKNLQVFYLPNWMNH
jgi:hypothetical protein